MHASNDVTKLLGRWAAGDRAALKELIPTVYDEMRRLARVRLANERAGHTLQPTALVHEAFLRIGSYDQISWENRAHFFAVASRVMRNILVDHARSRRATKRGGGAVHVTLSESQAQETTDVDLVALDEALAHLQEIDERQCRIVEMRYFGGLEYKEIAEVLGVSESTVKREWKTARLWLRRALQQIDGGSK